MDFVNKSYGQLADLFGTMTPAARITTGLLLAVIIASLTFLFRYQTDHADEYLFGGETVTQGELVAIEAAFGKAGLSNYEIVANKVRVPRLQRDKYLAALAASSALPQSFGSAVKRMFESDSPFDTRDIRERKAKHALEEDLSRIIRALPNIFESTVTITELPGTGFNAAKERRALVAVRALGSRKIDSSELTAIRHTVATGTGTKPEFVTVTDLNGNVSPGIGKENGVSEFENLYAAHQRIHVDHYTRILKERLAIYPGVQIAVHVELDKEVQNQTSTFKYDEKPTSIKSTMLTKETTSKGGDNGGRPGAVSNGATANASAQVAANSTNESTSNESREDTSFVTGVSQEQVTKASLTPFAVSASIGIPKSYFAKIWHMRNPPASGEDPKTPPADQLKLIEAEKIKEIEDSVQGLLPLPPKKGDDRYQGVRVVSYDETPIDVIAEPTLAENAFAWLADSWQTLGLFALAVFGVVFLRGMVRSAATVSPTLPADVKDSRASQAAELEQEEQAMSEESADLTANTLKKRFQSSGRGLRDELTELVREDPDAAASVLKLWIGNAA